MNTLEDTKSFLEKTAEEINFIKEIDRNEMYKYLIEQGNNLKELDNSKKTDENFVKGCTSNVYISINIKNNIVNYEGYADSVIVKGYLSILIKALSGLKKEDISKTEELVEKFANDIDIKASLTPSRANAFGNIFKTMKEKAQ